MLRPVKTIAAIAAAALLGAAHAQAATGPLGDVSFTNSCAAAAQTPFLRGLALLHDFEYADSAEAFAAAQKADPGCAIAYWGQAMTFNHTIWMDQDAAGAHAVLARLGATESARAKKAATPREAAYLHAIEVLYGPNKKEDRDALYAEEMAKLHARFPDDVDATAFYALALLGTSHGGRDIPTYMKAAALLEEVFPTHPHHPGVLHYMIHSYDDPAHAPLGMRAARLYGAIASGAPHAVHMTSHIFIALGMWDEVIAANDAAIRAVNARAAAGAPPYACGHYPEWLVYGYLQERRFTEAEAAISLCRARAIAKLSHRPQPPFADMSPVSSYADMLTRQSIETGIWRQEPALPLDSGAYVAVRLDLAYATALAAGSDAATLDSTLADLRGDLSLLQKNDAGAPDTSQNLQFRGVMAEEVAALDTAAHGNADGAIAALRAAALHETIIPTEFGPPAVPKPPYELLGDMLFKAKRFAEAADAYRAALVRSPGRTLSLQGLVGSEHALGQDAAAESAKALLARYVH